MSYPKTLVPELYWSFSNGVFDDVETFKSELLDYNEDNEVYVSAWNDTLLESKEVIVQFINYAAFGNLDDDEFDEESSDIEILIQANGNLQIGEFLFALNNLVTPHLEDADHHFFERLLFAGDPEGSEPPRYFLDLGS